ncbi:MAG: HAD-IC family P-type ATPase, partial [Acetobacterales bacterium]
GIPAESLVPGDIVIVEAGDKVPADLRLIEARGLSVQEALLTGESMPSEKHLDPVASDAPLGDRASMLFSGTLVAAGRGTGVVVATGPSSEIGRIGGMLSAVEVLTTPLVRQMDSFARWLTALILLAAALLFAWGVFVLRQDVGELFMVMVGLSVAAIPEGLPAVLTITLAIGVQRMARRNAIVRRLPAIETVGAVTVICTDKTGTLTRNEMTVTTLVTAEGRYGLSGVGYVPEGTVHRDGAPVDPAGEPLLEHLGRVAALCNDAALRHRDGAWDVLGDPMEGALLVAARKLGLAEDEQQAAWPRSDAIPFDAALRYMATLHHDHDGRGLVLVKGAPERVVDLCRWQVTGRDDTAELDADFWLRRAGEIADRGERVIALAMRRADSEHASLTHAMLEEDLALVGLVGLMDPPRAEAVEAVADCQAAGIRVKMITGDHARTAAAIGRLVGLRSPAVLTGAELDAMDDAALRGAVDAVDVFARTSPEHKLRLVMALQARGEVVAMTGDGVNDAPALKRAEAGIAMGVQGSAAAKEAAELVLADDNFASIAAAVREGRTVYDNLKKVITWTLPTNAGEAATVIVALMLGMTLPVTPIQILWINLVTAVTLGLALAFEPPEPGTMRRPPRRRDAPLLDGALVWTIVLVSVLFLCGVFGMFGYALARGYSVELARTIAVNTLVVLEIFCLFFIRNIHGTSLTFKAVAGTPAVWLTVGVTTAAQFAFTYLPPLQAVFGTRPVPLWDGIAIVGVGIAFFAVVEVEKQVRLRLARRPSDGPPPA